MPLLTLFTSTGAPGISDRSTDQGVLPPRQELGRAAGWVGGFQNPALSVSHGPRGLPSYHMVLCVSFCGLLSSPLALPWRDFLQGQVLLSLLLPLCRPPREATPPPMQRPSGCSSQGHRHCPALTDTPLNQEITWNLARPRGRAWSWGLLAVLHTWGGKRLESCPRGQRCRLMRLPELTDRTGATLTWVPQRQEGNPFPLLPYDI